MKNFLGSIFGAARPLDEADSSCNALANKRAKVGFDFLTRVYCMPNGEFIVCSTQSLDGTISAEAGNPVKLPASVDAVTLGGVVADQALAFVKDWPADMRTRKKSDWPAFRASGQRSMKSFEKGLAVANVTARPAGPDIEACVFGDPADTPLMVNGATWAHAQLGAVLMGLFSKLGQPVSLYGGT